MIGGGFAIRMPEGSRILHVAMQGYNPQMWAEVDTDKPTIERRFILMGTGWEFPFSPLLLNYIGTFLQGSGEYVWHIYEIN